MSGSANRIPIWKSRSTGAGVSSFPVANCTYNVNYNNNGNVAIDDTIYITDTLPVSTTFREAWKHDGNTSTPVIPVAVTADYVVWAISGLPNGYGDNFEVRAGRRSRRGARHGAHEHSRDQSAAG